MALHQWILAIILLSAIIGTAKSLTLQRKNSYVTTSSRSSSGKKHTIISMLAQTHRDERKSTVKIVCTASLLEYERAIEKVIQPGDKILEIASQLKETTNKLIEIASEGEVVGIDMARKLKTNKGKNKDAGSKKMYRTGNEEPAPSPPRPPAAGEEEEAQGGREERRRRAAFSFREVRDPLDARELLDAGQDFTAVCVDASIAAGNDLLLDGLALTGLLEALYRPTLRVVVVKSRALTEHAQTYLNTRQYFSYLQQGQQAFLKNLPFKVICVTGVEQYREVIPTVLEAKDRVLEIGCHSGLSTMMIQQHLNNIRCQKNEEKEGFAIGIDIGPKIVALAQKNHPEVRYEVGDAWDTAGLQRLCPVGEVGGFTCIFVDVGGLSGPDGLLEAVALVRQLRSGFPELHTIVIKSRCLRDHTSKLVVANRDLFSYGLGRAPKEMRSSSTA